MTSTLTPPEIAPMTDRPMIFSAPMIRALLSGSKRMTRRVLKPQPRFFELAETGWVMFPSKRFRWLGEWIDVSHTQIDVCTPWHVGDRLWVREAWADQHPLAVQAERYSQPGRAGIPGPPGVSYRTIYRADGEPLHIWRSNNGHPYFSLSGPSDEVAAKHPCVCSNFTRDGKSIHWDSSIHMPRWASRITLIVESVKVERLQGISDADAQAEGIAVLPLQDANDPSAWWQSEPGKHQARTPAGAFRLLWNDLHGPDAWALNPWVAAIGFRVIRANLDSEEARLAA